jgi:hypothetical protein
MNAKNTNGKRSCRRLRRKSADQTEAIAKSQNRFNRKERRGRKGRDWKGYLGPPLAVKAPLIQDDRLKRGEFAPRS